MRFWPRFALLCLLLLAAASPPAGGATATGPAVQSQELPPESTTLTIQLEADGDALWTVRTRFRLDDQNDSEAFDRLAADFEAGNANVVYDTQTFKQAAAAASNATGREMTITDVRYNASRQTVDNVTYGQLALRFRWTNFAATSGQRLRLGNAFNTTDGTWFPGLASDQTLIIRPPEGYAVLSSPPDVGVQNGSLRWEGPRSFAPGYLGQITYRGTTPTTDTPTEERELPLGLLGGGVVLLAVAAIAVVLARRGDQFGSGTGAATSSDGGGSSPTPDASPDPDGDARATGDGATTGTAAAGGATESDPELLSDEERVERLLERNGGRMKQATIVEETGWSNAKVSQLLSGMADDGRVDKLRIGRENLISLPEEDVADIEEPE